MGLFDHTSKLLRGTKKNTEFADDFLETEQEYKERWRSVYIIYLTMFLMSLGFSIIITGVWPYLEKLDPTAGKEFLGFIVAANPLGQMLFSPMMGWWTNKLGSIRIPVILSLFLFTIASATYSSIEVFQSHRKFWMLASRFLVGISSANVAACRSYLSAATKFSERTKAVAMISLAQVLGFVVGPAIQAAVVPLDSTGVWLIPGLLKLDMYTACGWINVLLVFCNILLFLPSSFKEYNIAKKEAMHKRGDNSEDGQYKTKHQDNFGAWCLIIAFFVLVFNFMLLETLGTPLIMDQFAWSEQESLKYMGILMSVGAVIAIITSLSIPYLTKKFPEVKVMIWGGFFLMVLGRACYIPFPFLNTPPKTFDSELKLNLTLFCKEMVENDVLVGNFSHFDYLYDVIRKQNFSIEQENATAALLREVTFNCGQDLLGCPSHQEWCMFTPALTVTQFILGYLLTSLGYPLGVTLIQTIFSKLLGPRPQGVWMGLMTGAGCFSRVMGPVFVAKVYESYGTIWTFGFTMGMMIVCLIWLIYYTERLTPMDINSLEENGIKLEELSKFDSDFNETEQKSEQTCNKT